MQPNYSQHWPINNYGQAQDAQFYTFFEDSLNQFISTNSTIEQSAVKDNTEQQKSGEQNAIIRK